MGPDRTTKGETLVWKSLAKLSSALLSLNQDQMTDKLGQVAASPPVLIICIMNECLNP